MKRMMLVVTGPKFMAAAEYCKDADGWRCYRSAPKLKYMQCLNPGAAKKYIESRGWTYEWSEIEPGGKAW